MKRLVFFGGMILLLSRCSTDPLETNNNSGLLKTITSYGGDSAQAGLQYQKFNFHYDAQGRVNLIAYHSDNLTVKSEHDLRFYYNGSDKEPYLQMDSSRSIDNSGTLQGISLRRTWFFYDASKNKIKDSSEVYFRTPYPPYAINGGYQPPQNHEVYSYTYQPSQLLVGKKSTFTGLFETRDTFFFDNQQVNIRKGNRIISYRTMNIDSYHDVVNPIAALNISKALFNRVNFMGVNFHPFTYEMGLPQKLPKSFSGRQYDVTDNQTMKLDFYLDKNTSGKLNKIVAAKRRFRVSTGTLFDFYYFNYTFDYYP